MKRKNFMDYGDGFGMKDGFFGNKYGIISKSFGVNRRKF